jgi:thiosulfate sulfurtransferase
MPGYQNITPEHARSLLATQLTTVLDLRDQRSYRAGHLDGALLLHDALMQTLIKQNDLDKPVLLYCYRGNASQERAQQFADLGFRQVYSLAGGYTDWQKG